MALQVRRYGRLTYGPHEGAGGRKPATEEDVCRGALESRDRRGGPDKKMVAPSQRREMAQWAVAQRSATIGLACQAFGISQTCYRYRAKLDAENAVVADWLVRLTNNQRNWGFGLCFLYLRNVKGFKWNHKRVYRIYRELELNLRIKPRHRLVREKPLPLAVPAQINETWSMDFMHDQLAGPKACHVVTDFDQDQGARNLVDARYGL